MIDPELPTEALLIPPTPALLVGGQALALWVNALDVPLPTALAGGVTVDVDFLGSATDAREHHAFLEIATAEKRMRTEIHFPQPFENTPNSAKITIFRASGIAAEIDYLSHIIGYVGKDEDRLKDRAIEITDLYFSGSSLHVMHPFDCLRSRLCNIHSLPSKRNTIHVAQARLALEVMRAFILKLTEEESDTRAQMYPLLEEIISLASSRVGVDTFHHFGIDVLSCLPVDQLPEPFVNRRLPLAQDYIHRRRFGKKGGKRVPKR
ncbi:hypothetical protein [Stenotrophomonas sp. PSU-St15]